MATTDPSVTLGAARRPAAGAPELRAEPAGAAGYYSVGRRPRPWTTTSSTASTGAWSWRSASATRALSIPDVLELAQTCTPSTRTASTVIAAYAEPAHSDDTTSGTVQRGLELQRQHQWAQGNQPGQDDLAQRGRQYETASTSARDSPDYSSSARPRANDVELDLEASTPAGRRPSDTEDDVRRRGRRAGRVDVPAASLRDQVRQHELPALGRVNDNSEVHLQPRPGRPGAEGRAVADARRRRLPARGRRPDPSGSSTATPRPTGSRARSGSRSRR
jgi:hypothetical protein